MSKTVISIEDAPLLFNGRYRSVAFGTISDRLKLLKPESEYDLLLEDGQLVVANYVGFGVFEKAHLDKEDKPLKDTEEEKEFIRLVPFSKEEISLEFEEFTLTKVKRFSKDNEIDEDQKYSLTYIENLLKYHGDEKGRIKLENHENGEQADINYRIFNYLVPYDKERVILSLDDKLIVVRVNYNFSI